MPAAIQIHQPEDALRLGKNREQIGTLYQHGRMRHRDHARWPWRKAESIRVLGVIHRVVSLLAVWRENQRLAGNSVLGNISARPVVPYTGEVRRPGRGRRSISR